MDHAYFMRRCLALAEEGRRMVGNGAMVGAVLVREGKIIAEGRHAAFGGPHAERDLLQRYEQKICSKDSLYINLEPCCHDGKTPPCTHTLIERGVKKMYVGMLDPDARVSGKGISMLRSAGVQVFGPVLRAECEYFNRGFTTVRAKKRPWITLKRAQTKGGAVAHGDDSRMKITSSNQDRFAHAFLRATHDAIAVGIETVIQDQPLLTTRISNKKIDQNWRMILDPHLRIPLLSTVLTDDFRSRTILVASTDVSDAKKKAVSDLGAQVFVVPLDGNFFAWTDLWTSLMQPQPGYDGITSILVEGGARTWNVFRSVGFVDEEVILVGNSQK